MPLRDDSAVRNTCLAHHHPGKQQPFQFTTLFFVCFPRGVARATNITRHAPSSPQCWPPTCRLLQFHCLEASTETPVLPCWYEYLWHGTIAIIHHLLHSEPPSSALGETFHCPLTVSTMHSGLQWQNRIRKLSPCSEG